MFSRINVPAAPPLPKLKPPPLTIRELSRRVEAKEKPVKVQIVKE